MKSARDGVSHNQSGQSLFTHCTKCIVMCTSPWTVFRLSRVYSAESSILSSSLNNCKNTLDITTVVGSEVTTTT